MLPELSCTVSQNAQFIFQTKINVTTQVFYYTYFPYLRKSNVAHQVCIFFSMILHSSLVTGCSGSVPAIPGWVKHVPFQAGQFPIDDRVSRMTNDCYIRILHSFLDYWHTVQINVTIDSSYSLFISSFFQPVTIILLELYLFIYIKNQQGRQTQFYIHISQVFRWTFILLCTCKLQGFSSLKISLVTPLNS